MIELLDKVIETSVKLGNTITIIILDVRSYEQLHIELGQKNSKLTGYKGYKIKVSFENCFSGNFFKIETK